MTEEDMHRNETYRILEQLRGCEVEGNETGWYDGFIEDAYKDGASPEDTARSIMNSEAMVRSQECTQRMYSTADQIPGTMRSV